VLEIGQQVALLMQGSEYGDVNLQRAMVAELRERLLLAQKEQRPLRVYCGYDPTTADLHLGHTVTMRKLRQFQELGHEVTFLIGDYTARVGDPSDKDKLRPQLSEEQIHANAQTFAEQAFRILDRSRTAVRFNSEWLGGLSLADLIRLASNFTVQQFVGRENFRQRWDRGDAIFLHETFYAILQGYDAYSLRADVQVGGSDQLFNIVTAARKVMEALGADPNIALLLGILPGTDGVVRMSKSLGNHISLLATAEDMYGKIMSLPDSAMMPYFRLLSRWPPEQIDQLEVALQTGATHPRDAKMMLAREIVEIYHGPSEVEPAESAFRRIFQQNALPQDLPEATYREGAKVVEFLAEQDLVESRSQARRLIEQGGVRLDGVPIRDLDATLFNKSGSVLQVGKRKFLRLKAGR
jgi:tyrosyl-tRNA synthetase